MKLRPRDRVKLVNDTVLFISFVVASATGILKMPVLADSLSDDLFDRFQGLPWGVLNFLHDWCGVLALACVLLHLALVWRRYFWLLRNTLKRQD